MSVKKTFGDIRVLVVEDDDLLRRVIYDRLISLECEVMAADSLHDARKLLAAEQYDVLLSDMRLPDGSGMDLLKQLKAESSPIEVVMMTAYADVETAVASLKLGAFDYLSKPFENEQLDKILRNVSERHKLVKKIETLAEHSMRAVDGFVQFDQMIGTEAMADIFKMTDRVAKYDTTVLILGESGAGKGMLSKAIHRASPRAQFPFVEINCSAIPEHLLESELFGYEKGAFTDAKNKKIGLFEVAEGGTIFLDEIGDMDVSLQAKILKVLEDKEFRRLGALKSSQVDVRIIAATNRNLKELVDQGKFREDLYYRLSVVPIKVPPLRDHVESIEPLARYFLQLFSKQMGIRVDGFEAAAIAQLKSYSWPGNVRELRNVVERGVILSDGDQIKTSALGLTLVAGEACCRKTEMLPLAEVEKRHIRHVLESQQGNRTAAAEILQIHRTTLYKKIEAYDLGQICAVDPTP